MIVDGLIDPSVTTYDEIEQVLILFITVDKSEYKKTYAQNISNGKIDPLKITFDKVTDILKSIKFYHEVENKKDSSIVIEEKLSKAIKPYNKVESKEDFLMPIQKILPIQNKGIVLIGKVESGIVKAKEKLSVVCFKGIHEVIVKSIEKNKIQISEAAQGEYIGIMIDSLQKEKFKSGQVIATPGLIEPHTQFKCELYIYTKAEGGSGTLKYLHNGAKLSFDFWTTKIRGEISISKSVKKLILVKAWNYL